MGEAELESEVNAAERLARINRETVGRGPAGSASEFASLWVRCLGSLGRFTPQGLWEAAPYDFWKGVKVGDFWRYRFRTSSTDGC